MVRPSLLASQPFFPDHGTYIIEEGQRNILADKMPFVLIFEKDLTVFGESLIPLVIVKNSFQRVFACES